MIAARNLGAVAALSLVVFACQAPAAEPPAALRFRRVLVPEQDIDQVVRGLLPMRRAEFERRITLAQAAGQRGASPSHIASARYSARLDGNALVDGQMELTVLHQGPSAALLELAPADLAIHEARWTQSGEGEAQPAEREAQLGIDPTGKLVCRVSQSGTLSASWSLSGQRDHRGELVFQFRLPPSPHHELTLELPGEQVLTAEGAIATRLAPSADGLSGAGKTVRWRLACASPGTITLRIARSARPPTIQNLVLVKQQSNYSVHRGSIDLEAFLDLEALSEPLSHLVFHVDSPLELIAVRLGETRLNWSPVTYDGPGQRMAVEFSPPLVGRADDVRLTATAPWDGRGATRLPAIQVTGATWQEGQITVAAEGALQLVTEPQRDCRTLGYSAATPGQSSSTWQFQQLTAEADVQISLAQNTAALLEHSATSFEFGATQIAGTFTAEVTATEGLHFALTAEIARAWIVDSVEVQPPDMLADRALATSTTPLPGAAAHVLRLTLRRPIAAGRKLRLVVRAHQRRPPDDQWLPKSFNSLVNLDGIRDARRLLTWQVTDPAAQLSLTDEDRLRRLDSSSLPAADLRLFDAPPQGPVFHVDRAAAGVQVRLVRTSGNYRMNALVRANIDPTSVQEEWRLRFTPEETALNRIVVHRRPATSDLGVWQILGADAREFTVRRLASVAGAGGDSVFEITFSKPRLAPFEMAARFVRRRSEHQELGLVSSPAAAMQTGRAEIHAAPDCPLAIATDGLQPAPLDDAVLSLPTLRGLFQYDPGQTARLTWHTPRRANALPLAWVESLDVTSAYLPDGSARHEAVITVHSVGQDRLVFRLPGNATAAQWQTANSTARSLSPGAGHEYSVPVNPAGSTELCIRYGSRQSPPGWSGSSLAMYPAPATDLQVLKRQWQVRLPAELLLLSPTAGKCATSSPDSLDRHWTTFSIPLRPDSLPSLRLAKRNSVTAWSVCVGLCTFVALIYGHGQLARFGVLAAIAAGASMLLPAALTPLAAAGIFGLLTGVAWLLVTPRNRAAIPKYIAPPLHASSSVLRRTAGAVLLLAMLAPGSRGQIAESPRASDLRTSDLRTTVWRVVIPVNDSRRPVGEYVFLEPELYDALVARTEQLSLGAPEWLLTSAVYRPMVAAGTPEVPLRIEEIGVTFAVETFRPHTTVELDFRRTDMHLVERTSRLDGKPIVLAWNEDGSKLRAEVEVPGKHRLEMAFGARPQATPEGGELELTIPRAAASWVELQESARNVQLSDPRGAAEQRSPQGNGGQPVRTTNLGAAPRLALRWSSDGVEATAPLRIEGEQLLLWTIRPGSVAAQAKFRIRPVGGPIRHVVVELDSRLRVIPPTADSKIGRQWIERAGSSTLLHIDLVEPAGAEVIVPVTLVAAEASGIGNFTLPHVRLQADEVKRSWHALALAGDLAWNPPPARRDADPTASEFGEAWGEALPRTVVALDADLPDRPELQTQPLSASITADERLDCSVSQDELVVRYAVELSGAMPNIYMHRLKLEPDLRVSSLEVLALGASVRADWTQSADGGVTITQHQSPTGNQQIKITARRPLPKGAPILSAPRIEYVGAKHGSQHVRIFRQSDVSLNVTADSRHWTAESAASLGQFQDGLGRLAAAYRGAAGSFVAPPTVAVESNDPIVGGHVLTRLVPAEGTWGVEIDVALELDKGELDTARFTFPPQFDPTVAITPAAEYEFQSASGQPNQLVIRPQRSLTRSARLKIQGRVLASDWRTLRPTAAWFRGASRVRHLVALPASYGGQRFRWDTTGMQAVDVAMIPASLGSLPAGYELFDVVTPQHAAVMRTSAALARSPHVRRAEHQLRRLGDLQMAGRSQLIVLPRGAEQFDLTLGPNCQLLHATLDGVPAQLVNRGAATWSLPHLDSEREYVIGLTYVVGDSARTADAHPRFQPPSICRASYGDVVWDVEAEAWTPLAGGAVHLSASSPPPAEWRWPAWLALAGSALCWIVGKRTALVNGLARLAPLGLALLGAAWLAAGTWSFVGWLAIAASIWIAIRWPWPRTSDHALSGLTHPAR